MHITSIIKNYKIIARITVCWLMILPCALLQAQDERYTEWYLKRDDTHLFVKETGTGTDTVIVVHGGFGANHDYMTDAIKGLEDRFHFVLYDQRGSLMSPTPKEQLTFQKNVDDLYALIKALQLKKAKLFCHSMGTLLGMEFVRQHPEMVSCLVLTGAIAPKVDSLPGIFSEDYEKRIDFLVNRKEVAALMQPYKNKGIDSVKTIADMERSGLSHKEMTEYWRIKFAAVNIYNVSRHHLVKGGRAYYKQDATVMGETVNWSYDYRNVLNDSVRTTIINGAYDFLDFNGASFGDLLKGYKNVELHIIPEAGHNSWIDHPDLFKKYLVAGLTYSENKQNNEANFSRDNK